MRKGFRNYLLLLLLQLIPALALAQQPYQEPIKVAFVVPGEEHIPYWYHKVTFMRAVAEDLGIDLRVTYSKANEISLSRSISTVLNSKDKPDYFLTGRWTKVIRSLIRLADRRGIKTLTFNAAFGKQDRLLIGYPREQLKSWIGEMSPQNENAGYKLADILINRAKNNKSNAYDKIKVLSIGAYQGDVVSEARVAGLKRRLEEKGDAILLDVALGGWRQYIAEEIVLKAFEQYDDVDVIWAASDEMVLGVIDAAKQAQRIPGKDFVTGGFDWYKDNIELIVKNEIAASLGGQFFEGGLALVLIHDYHYGHDFAKSMGTSMFMPMYAVTSDNVYEYKEKLETTDWSNIDFRQFSKVYNKKIIKYDFSLEAVMDGLEPNKQ